MATWYYNLAAGSNGTGTPGSPFNTWPGTTVSAGDSHLFMRSTTATVAFAISSGANGAITTYGAWYNGDGSDDTSKARPVIGTTVVMSSFASRKGHLRLENLEIRGNSLPVANDSALVFLSDSATVVNCTLQTNIGGIGIWGSSNVTIQSANVQAVSHVNTNNNNCLTVAGTTAMSEIRITNTTFVHLGGGGTASHAVVIACDTAVNALSSLTFRTNVITTNTLASNSNLYAIALKLSRCPGADISYNTMRYHLTGIFMSGGGTATSATIAWNTCQYNRHFGIHLTTDTNGCLIERNVCSNNGTSTNNAASLFAYGRGIELSSAAGQSKCASHVVRYNTCDNNYNWGGPGDNGSEGVGIGLDDGTVNCTVYANNCENNEGNGIQLYGGGNTTTWTDTHNSVYGNFLRNNCTASYTSRRSGGTDTNGFNADIHLTYVYGGITYIAHNTHAGTTPVGVSMDSNCSASIKCANNIFLSIAHPITDGRSIVSGYEKNCYFNATQIYSTRSTNASGSATFAALAYTGTNDYTFDPQVDANYRLRQGSTAIAAGVYLGSGITDYIDHGGSSFKNPPSLGMFEFSLVGQTWGGNTRKRIMRNR